MALVRLSNAQLAYGNHSLLDHTDFSIEAHETVALVGRNGAGKSTLLQVIAGDLPLDDGEINRQSTLKVAMLAQAIPSAPHKSAREAALHLAGDIGQAHLQYLKAFETDDGDPDRSEALAHQIDQAEAWGLPQIIDDGLKQLNIDGDAEFEGLSGGKKRLLALLGALAQKPDLLLLDEPTNHLDLSAIEQLRSLVAQSAAAVLLITHDRAFMRAMARRVVELDRGKLYSYDGDYSQFLRNREARLAAQETAEAQFDKKLAQEEVWVRQGIKARRTRNEGRVRALKAMRDERSKRVSLQQNPNFSIESGSRSGKRVLAVEGLGYRIDERELIRNFSTQILRGDRVGIIGANGIGKTTLLRLMLDKLTPSQGSVELGTNLQVAYFDQLRAQLDDNKTVLDNVSGGSEHVTINGQSRHIISYLSDFLFTPERIRSPINKLSGGERNRLLLAKLFVQASNLLVLDEPTNDLDLESLELLEQLLVSYEGTLLLVSHDREFVDNVVTSVIAFEGDGIVNEFVGGYSDWLDYRSKHPISEGAQRDDKDEPKPSSEAPSEAVKKRKLSYKEQRELSMIPAQIDRLESRQQSLEAELSDGQVFVEDPQKAAQLSQTLAQTEVELLELLNRWASLEP